MGLPIFDQAKRQRFSVCSPIHTAHGEWLLRTHPELSVHPSKSDFAALQDLRDGKCAGAIITKWHWQQAAAMKKYNEKCNFGEVGNLPRFDGAMIAKVDSNQYCTSMLAHVVATITESLHREGFIRAVRDEALDAMHDMSCLKEDAGMGEDGALYLRDVAGIFCIPLFWGLIALIWKGCSRKEEDKDGSGSETLSDKDRESYSPFP